MKPSWKPGVFAAVLVGSGLVCSGLVSPCKGQKESTGEIRRVLLLVPPRPETTNPQAQPRIEQARAARSKARRKPRRRLFASPETKSEPKPEPKLETKPVPSPLSRNSAGGNKVNPTGNPAGKRDDGTPKSASGGKPGDIVPPDQRATLAQALLADVLAERLHDRLGLTVVGESEIEAALTVLHLTRSEAARPENARRLCVQTGCQAVLIPRLTACVIQESATRNVAVFARITVAQVAGTEETTKEDPKKEDRSKGETGKGESGREETVQGQAGKVKTEAHGTGHRAGESTGNRWPTLVDVAGTAFADRVLFHKQYKRPQGDLIRDAAQQAANLLLHQLTTGEKAPFMRSTDRLAVTPVPAPSRADKLVFTPSGRRVQPSAVGDLDTDVSTLFTPDLLPVIADRIVDAPTVRHALPAQDPSGATLWQDEDTPSSTRIRTLARALHVDYVLLAHVADVELSEGASTPRTASDRNTAPVDRERAARVEAVAALVRASDGVLLWHDRATATMTAPMNPGVNARPLQTDQKLIHDATRFALVELERRLRTYRTMFEK